MANNIKEAPKKGVIGWIDHRLPIFTFMDHELNKYPTPKNLNIWWNFGSLAGIMLMIMIITGIFLAMNYTANTHLAFDSVERIMRDVNGGWVIRYLHMNGASMFFIVVYIHIFRGLYYGSYKGPRELLWALGVAIFLLMMATAFMGYVLPWGQMSLWGAEVITNFFSAIPVIGDDLVQLTRGSFAVDNPTLTRFFALHYLMPFLIVGLVVVHLIALHRFGSNNPKGIDITSPKDKIPFNPYYTIKDLLGLGIFLMFYSGFVFFAPDYLGHPDNYIPANPLQTPAHIVPEWYFLPFYAILRAIDFDIPLLLFTINSKLAGVIAMFASVLVLFFIPLLDRHPVRSAKYRPWYRVAFWVFVLNAIVLGYIGSQPPSGHMIVIGQAATAWYFIHFFVLLPLLSKYEPVAELPKNLDDEVVIKPKKQTGSVQKSNPVKNKK